jgi:hypothetical protein
VKVLLPAGRRFSLPRFTAGSFLGLPESVALFNGLDEVHSEDARESCCQEALDSTIRQRELSPLFLRQAKGADVNMVDTKGRAALAMASRAGNPEIVQILKQHGATR